MSHQVCGDNEYDTLIKPIMMINKVISFWPLEKNYSTSEKLFRICHKFWMFFLLITMSFGVTNDIIHKRNDLDELTACALIGSAFYIATIRLIVYTIYQKDMLYVLETMRKDWICSSYENRVILKEKCLFSFKFSKYFIILVTSTLTAFAIIPILEVYIFDKEKVLPFHGYFFFNFTVSPIYECMYIYNIMGGYFGGCTVSGVSTLNFVATIHGSAKFVVLQRRLKSINSNNPDANREMINCIKDHQDTIIFADTLERIINILALGQFMISTGLVCFAGFQITTMMENKTHLMKYMLFLNSTILELFMFSFSGNALIDESNAVGESAYFSHWIGGTFSRNLQIMMIRSKIPSKITVAKFYNMSLESFSKVLSTSFSYIMFLKATNEK